MQLISKYHGKKLQIKCNESKSACMYFFHKKINPVAVKNNEQSVAESNKVTGKRLAMYLYSKLKWMEHIEN